MNRCIECNAETTNPKFCGRSCSVTFHNRGRNRHGTEIGDCVHCGKKLNRSAKKYCSRDCMHEHRWQEQKLLIERGEADCSERLYKKYLIEVRGECCEVCGWAEVHSTTGKVPIEMHHVDGDSNNNLLENLQLLCPNHHSLTKTYKALNLGNGRKSR